jgi:ribosomal protein S15P/S13E
MACLKKTENDLTKLFENYQNKYHVENNNKLQANNTALKVMESKPSHFKSYLQSHPVDVNDQPKLPTITPFKNSLLTSTLTTEETLWGF